MYNRDEVKKQIKEQIVTPLALALDADTDIYKNTIDPLFVGIDCMFNDITFEEWEKIEYITAFRRNIQQKIGDIHEIIVRNMEGWKKGSIVDARNDSKKMLVEIKNKHNTTKGNHKPKIYEDLEYLLTGYDGYTGYYVEMLSLNCKRYNKPFTPSDNKNKTKKEEREDIRRIDGKSFYSLITGNDDAIIIIYKDILLMISEILNEMGRPCNMDSHFNVLLDRVFV